jgi:hypothetical protein
MILEAKSGAGRDHQALHLEARSLVDGLEPAPRAVDPAVELGDALVVDAHPVDQPFEVGSTVASGHQHRVGSLDDGQVVDADRRDQPRLRLHQVVVPVLDDDSAPEDVA